MLDLVAEEYVGGSWADSGAIFGGTDAAVGNKAGADNEAVKVLGLKM